MSALKFDQIRLNGFKSFVEPTLFSIEPGLTGIVGPNGCGKSNLLEAIRWVMGANSAKAMRAGAMDDVIFSGTQGRPGRNQADVTLYIDNTARMAPPMFNDDDKLEILRLIKKGGGSTYKVNGKTVRAKDVQLLFADASTGANSPALVRQGQINELISAKPSNRRRILEEAAGISGLHTRRHEAELRLRAAENNLDRLDDVIQQIDAQLSSLRRQSRQATRYKRLAGEIREYKALLWHKRWQLAIATLGAAKEELSAIEVVVADTAKLAASLTTKAQEIAAELDPKREEQLIAAGVFARLNAAKEALANDEEAAKGELRKLEQQIANLSDDLNREQAIIDDAGEALGRLGAEYDMLAAVSDTSAAIEDAQIEAKKAADTRADAEGRVNDLTRRSADLLARRDSAQRELSRAQTRSESLDRELAQAKDGLERLLAGRSEAGNQNLFEAALGDHAKALETARQTETNLQDAKTDAETADRAARDVMSEKKQAVSELRAEHKALSDLLSRGQGEAVWTPVLDTIDVRNGYEKALVAAFGDDLDAALGGDAPLRWNGADAPNAALPNGAAPLSDFVKAPAALAASLSQVGLIDRADSSLADKLSPGQRLVSKEGDLWRWDGFIANADAPSPAAQKLEQQNRLAVLIGEIDAAEAHFNAAQAGWEKAREARNSAETAARDARRALPDLERAERAAQAALSSFQTDVARETAQRQAAEDRIERLELDVSETAKRLAQAQEDMDAQGGLDEIEAELETAQIALEKARADAAEAGAVYRSLSNEAAAREARLAAVKKEQSQWTGRRSKAEQRVTILGDRLQSAKSSFEMATSGPDQFAQRRETLFAELDVAEKRRAAAQDALAETESRLKQAENEVRDAEHAHNDAREKRAAAQARRTAAEERQVETAALITETLSCEPAELKEHLGDLDPESKLTEPDIERKLERMSREREKMGAVNLRADEEAEEQEARMNAMNDERADLIAAIARLREGIDELNTEGRERLLKAFDTVNGHFGRLFTTLFGGGHASLALTESDDPLEAGLEVMVSPPGKKLGSMSLMSGGEQALTATALIFAVFLSNPAPICVLDEVDAPLDDANVDRYCNLLDAMTKSTQTRFITITHNPVTMARMDRLFGVTMAEKGVSTLVSVDLKAAERLTAAN